MYILTKKRRSKYSGCLYIMLPIRWFAKGYFYNVFNFMCFLKMWVFPHRVSNQLLKKFLLVIKAITLPSIYKKRKEKLIPSNNYWMCSFFYLIFYRTLKWVWKEIYDIGQFDVMQIFVEMVLQCFSILFHAFHNNKKPFLLKTQFHQQARTHLDKTLFIVFC